MGNEYPSMKTWQADTFVTWEVLAEMIVALGIGEKIRWDQAVERAKSRCDEDMHMFIEQTVEGIRNAVSAAESDA